MRTNNEQGVMLIASTFMVTVLLGFSIMALNRTIGEVRALERDTDRIQAYCAAEAGFQGALSQIGTTSYTGYVNMGDYSTSLYVGSNKAADCSATMSSENSDFIIIQSTGVGRFSTRRLEARVFLDSNLSKYLVYADTTSFASGTNATYGEPMKDESGNIVYDGSGRAMPPQDPLDRASMYFTGNWEVSGSNTEVYGDVYVKGNLVTDSGCSGDIHGDTYTTGSYLTNGTLTINDSYDDGVDKHLNDTTVDTITPIDLTFYANHNNIASYGTTTANRYLQFVVSADGEHTVVKEYNNRTYSTLVTQYDLPTTAIVYVKGCAFVKGTIKGRVSVVASDDIYIQGSLTYANGSNHADQSDAAAYLAKDRLFFCGNTMDVCGIFCAQRSTSSSSYAAFDATYDTTGASNPTAKVDLNVYGNRIIKGTSNLSYYDTREYVYDSYLKRFRPPGLPVTSVVSFIREV